MSYKHFVQVILVKLDSKSSELVFEPGFPEIEAVLSRLITAIVENAQGLPRVEHVLFSELQGCELVIPAMNLNEELVEETREKALHMLRTNFVGPQK